MGFDGWADEFQIPAQQQALNVSGQPKRRQLNIKRTDN